MSRAALLLLPGLLPLLGCAGGELAGGGGIETNNTLSLQLSRPDGSPAAGALVRVRPWDWVGEDTAGAPGFLGRADSAGRLEAPLAVGRWVLEARTADRGRILHLPRLHLADTAVALRLDSLGAVVGNVLPLDTLPVPLALVGTSRRFATDAAGRYRLDSLSPGSLRIAFLDGSGRTDSLHVSPGRQDTLEWTGSPALRRPERDTGLLLDDFRSTVPAAARLGAQASWYLTGDQKSGGTSKILKEDGTEAAAWGDLISRDLPGRAHLEMALGTGAGSYAQAGLELAPKGMCVDFSALDSVVLVARGSGSLRVDFHTALQDSLDDLTSSLGFKLAPGPGWQRVRVPVDSLRPMSLSPNQDVTWARAGGCVLELRFVALNSARIEIAGVRVHGPTSRELAAPVTPP